MQGLIDAISRNRVAGWVWDRSRPSQRLRLVVRHAQRALAEFEACELRLDLAAAGIGDGRYAFDVELDESLSDEDLASLVVELEDGSYRLPLSERVQRPLQDCQLNVENIDQLRSRPPEVFGFIRFDPNLDCNLHCVYCHNHRSKDRVDTGIFADFLRENVVSVDYFQVGCVMEPTLDVRLADLMLMVADSPAKPKLDFMLQTNGILLHRHNHAKLAAAGLTTLSVSVDAAEPATQKLLRNGTSLDKVLRNVRTFRSACPDVDVEFIATVTSANIDKLGDLVTLGLDLGVKKFVFREMFYYRNNDVVDHTRMPELLLGPGVFAAAKRRLIDEFAGRVALVFADNQYLERSSRKIVADSLLSRRRATALPSVETEHIEGFLDRVHSGWVSGWIWVPERPNDPVDVDLVIDGVRAAGARASTHRVDLELAGKGNGRHAFQIRIPARLRDGREHEVRIVRAGSTADVTGSPARVTLVAEGSATLGAPSKTPGIFHSPFGGLWTDRRDAREIVSRRRSAGRCSDADAELLRTWIDRGFVILPAAVSHADIDELDRDVNLIWEGTSPARCFVEHWEGGQKVIQKAAPRHRDLRVRLLDLYSHFESARRILFADPILHFLNLIFERPAMAFQSLYFRLASLQDIHQDAAFVKVSSPMEFAASWVALEDVEVDSGELEYYVGSHRLEDYLFDAQYKWMPEQSPELGAYLASLHTRCQSRGMPRQRFAARKGDVLMWSADFAHGGRKTAREDVTRRSLVTHYCPTDCEPMYGNPGVGARERFGSAYYTAERYG